DGDLPLERKLQEVIERMHEHFRAVVSAVIALGLRERPAHGPEHRERHLSEEAHLVRILEDLLAPDAEKLAVPVATVAEFVRITAFDSSMSMRESRIDDAMLAELIAHGILNRKVS